MVNVPVTNNAEASSAPEIPFRFMPLAPLGTPTVVAVYVVPSTIQVEPTGILLLVCIVH